MSSLIKEAENLRRGLVSDMDRSMHNDEKDLLMNGNDRERMHNDSKHNVTIETKNQTNASRK